MICRSDRCLQQVVAVRYGFMEANMTAAVTRAVNHKLLGYEVHNKVILAVIYELYLQWV